MLGKVVVSDGDKTYKGRSYLPIPEPLPLYLRRKVYFDERGKPALNKDPVALPHRIVLGVLRQFCPEWDIQSQYEAIDADLPWNELGGGLQGGPVHVCSRRGAGNLPQPSSLKEAKHLPPTYLEGKLRESVLPLSRTSST
jgi:hypothetical protein